MKLGTFDRLILLNILPPQGDVVTMRVVRDLQSALGHTEEEIAALGLRQDPDNPGKVTWRKDAEKEVDIPIGEAARGVIVEVLSGLSDKKMLKLEHLGLYDKFFKPEA